MLFRDDSPSFLTLAGALDEVFWLGTADANAILYVSPAFERIWPGTCAELLRNPRVWLDALHPEDRPRVERALTTFLSPRGAATFDEQYRLVSRDGSARWIRQRIVTIPAQADALDRLLTLARDVTELRQAQEALNDSHERLLRLTQYQGTIHEAQRTRIAREIHDELGQALTVLNLDLHWLTKRCRNDEPIRKKLGDMREMIERTAKTVQDITLRLRPANLGAFGLEGALNWYINRFRQQNEDLTCRQTVRLGDISLDQDTSIALYRILQEALTNISRHARASRVTIEVSRDGDAVSLTVEDDGIGITEQEQSRGDAWGLIGMRERVDALGGRFSIASAAAGGTRLSVRLPLAVPGNRDLATAATTAGVSG